LGALCWPQKSDDFAKRKIVLQLVRKRYIKISKTAIKMFIKLTKANDWFTKNGIYGGMLFCLTHLLFTMSIRI
jgi:hypothetical protein